MPPSPRLAAVGSIACMIVLTACARDPDASAMPSATATASPVPTASATASAPSATASSSAAPTPTPVPQPSDPLLAVELTDVRSGQAFTLAEVAATEGPVLLEPMAIWCTSCRDQHREVVKAHAAGEFASVSLDVDLTERQEDLAAYADAQGWDWRFAMADADLYRLLQERFGTLATHPPSTPLIVIERDGTVRPLAFGAGIRSAERLLDELGG